MTKLPISFCSGTGRSTPNKVERNMYDVIKKAKIQKFKNGEKLRKCSSIFARLRTPVKKPGRSKIQNFLMYCKIQNFVMNYQRRTKVIVKKQNVTGYDSTFFLLFVQGFNVDVLYRIRGFPWRTTSYEFASAIACAFFVPFFSSESCDCTHCRQTVFQLHTLPRVQGITVSPFFSAGL